jgi:hypothetical protein
LTLPHDKLAQRVRRLLRNPDHHIVELLGGLRQLHDVNRVGFVALVERSPISIQDALDLVKLDSVLASTDFPAERLRQIGLDRALMIAPSAETPEKAVALLQLAETHSLGQLRAIVRGDDLPPRLTPFGSRPGAETVTRFTVRVRGALSWSLDDSTKAQEKLDASLNRLLKAGELALSDMTPGQRITEVVVFLRGPEVPHDGLDAKQMGFVREDNPFRPGTRQHARWIKQYGQPDWSDFEEGL